MLDSFYEILGGLGDLEKIDAKGIREHNMAEHLKARMVRKGRMSSMGHENDPDEPVAEQICELIRELDDADRRCEESGLGEQRHEVGIKLEDYGIFDGQTADLIFLLVRRLSIYEMNA